MLRILFKLHSSLLFSKIEISKKFDIDSSVLSWYYNSSSSKLFWFLYSDFSGDVLIFSNLNPLMKKEKRSSKILSKYQF
jgi:hypothetical protein